MRLVWRLAWILCGLLTALLCGVQLLTYLSLDSRLERGQELDVQARLQRLAGQCAAFWGDNFEARCLKSLYYLIDLTEEESFRQAMILDQRCKVLLHSDFLRGDYSQRGRVAVAAGLGDACEQAGPAVMRSGPYKTFSLPAGSKNGRIGVLAAQYDAAGLREARSWARRDALRRLSLLCLVGLGLGVILAVSLAVHLLRPLDEILDAADKVGAGELKHRIPVRRDDELGRLAAEFNRMTARLAELDELKEGFLARITHDLRAPLGAVTAGLGNLLAGRHGPLSAEQSGVAKSLQDHVQALGEVLNNMLDVTRLEAGRLELERVPTDLQSEIDSVLELMRMRAEPLGVRLSAHPMPGLPEVQADPQALRRVLMNLVSNAVKFTPKGGGVGIRAYRGKPGEVVVAVSDTGIGIPKERIGSLFAKFSQVPETRNKVRESEGVGLGLVICREIVEAHGGRIWVESELFRGTTVYLSIPERGP